MCTFYVESNTGKIEEFIVRLVVLKEPYELSRTIYHFFT